MSIAKGVQYLRNESQSFDSFLHWNELSADTIRNCSKHTELLKDHDEAASFIDLEYLKILRDEERQEIEDGLAEFSA